MCALQVCSTQNTAYRIQSYSLDLWFLEYVEHCVQAFADIACRFHCAVNTMHLGPCNLQRCVYCGSVVKAFYSCALDCTMWPASFFSASFGWLCHFLTLCFVKYKYCNCFAIWRPTLEWICICVVTCVCGFCVSCMLIRWQSKWKERGKKCTKQARENVWETDDDVIFAFSSLNNHITKMITSSLAGCIYWGRL